ncbi:hypothetical protein LTR64_007675 [Lithohypha guttulata]|uniref:TPR1-like CTLH-containing domain-containing protein n=1 Tax=Lithohypha guttulata TaxID=1690604 RepID=A0AAN7YA12_9EURO|nr:hypothetical protein LTR51_007184 [Lithohypha guttulata]KAK5084374.1 hypothetical protein LTR05_005450 [Lithohypha guttulata]
MRPDEANRNIVSNGYSNNPSFLPPRKTSFPVNGHSTAINGSGQNLKNGTSKRRIPRNPTYRGHNREELTRILIQGLKDMGYETSASTLSAESGYELESNEVAAFRSAILSGHWPDAERILTSSPHSEGGGMSGNTGQSLILAGNANKRQMLFAIRQQKFLELLVSRDLLSALKVLREELTPLHFDTYQLHTLSGLLMCTQQELETQLHWPEDPEEARQSLLEELTRSIAPSVMIRDHRLAELLDQVKSAQINQCLYHNTAVAPSLYSDHMCSQEDFPTKTWMILEEHVGEVYCVSFSPDGKWLATAGEDRMCIIYDAVNFRVVQKLQQHDAPITHLAWSPDSKKLLTAAEEPRARVWDALSGKLIMTVEHNNSERRPITSGAWLPDSLSLVTCCHDRDTKMCLWSLSASDLTKPIHTWSGEFRVADVAITPDGRRLLCNDMDSLLVVYDMNTYREEFRMKLSSKITCITPSRDNRTILVNIAEGEVQLIDIENRYPVRKFKGLSQGKNIIRNAFGGAAENFVVSGSKDGAIYIWHKENLALIETLRGHGKGSKSELCVTSISWNPRDAGMFASGGDDRKVRIWSNAVSDDSSMIFDPRIRHPDLGRTSALRSTSNL